MNAINKHLQTALSWQNIASYCY